VKGVLTRTELPIPVSYNCGQWMKPSFSAYNYEEIKDAEDMIEIDQGEAMSQNRDSNLIDYRLTGSYASSKYSSNGTLYLFTPNRVIPKLRLFDGKTLQAPLKAIIREKCLIVITQTDENWNYILCREIEGWCQFNRTNETVKEALSRLPEYTRYQEWRGNNVFFFDGQLMFGSDFNFFVFTNILYTIPSLLFFLFVLPDIYLPELVGVSILFIMSWTFPTIIFSLPKSITYVSRICVNNHIPTVGNILLSIRIFDV
jgi:hypothetical protein